MRRALTVEDQLPPVEPPEAMQLRYQCKKYGVLYWGGGLGDQPYVLMREWDVVDAAEKDFYAFKTSVAAQKG